MLKEEEEIEFDIETLEHLLSYVANLQEFMEDNGLSEQQFKDWLNRKRERTLH